MPLEEFVISPLLWTAKLVLKVIVIENKNICYLIVENFKKIFIAKTGFADITENLAGGNWGFKHMRNLQSFT